MKFYSLSIALFLSACSVGSVPELRTASDGSRPLATIAKIPEMMEAFGAAGLAVSAVSGDEIIFSQGFGVTSDGTEFASSTSCGLYSATKVLASLTYSNLAADDRISLGTPLAELIEDAPADWTQIPFYRLLNHTSGITMVVNKEGFGDLIANPEADNRDVYQMVRDAPLDYQPGEFSRYRQSGYAVGEIILQDNLGASFDELVSEYILVPADMANTQHASAMDENEPAFLLSAGGFRSTADDMAKMFLNINNGSIIVPHEWKTLLLDEKYLFDDYSLGSIVENRDGILTIGHSGGGARANVRYAPDQKVGVMICTDDRQTNRLAIPLARMLVHEIITGVEAPLPILVALAGYENKTGAQVVAGYKSAEGQSHRYDFSEAQSVLNQIGYSFLSREKVADAIAVFTLNVETFPGSPNAHDSLGEALLAFGDSEGALAQYRMVLSLEPGNENANSMIETILSKPAEGR